jgi:ABC-type sugar transport system ATPase subunit
MAGLVGAGRTEVVRAIYGLDRRDGGTVEVDGRAVKGAAPRTAIRAGLVLVPEERKTQGLVLDASISDNIVLPHLTELSTARWLRNRAIRAYSTKVSKDVGVKAASTAVPVRNLSGGNQQKVVLGRWLSDSPGVYILDEPTRGIDVGSKSEIYALIERLARQGAAVLVVSSELPELLGICDRILVMRAGRLVGERNAATATEESILALAMGAQTS